MRGARHYEHFAPAVGREPPGGPGRGAHGASCIDRPRKKDVGFLSNSDKSGRLMQMESHSQVMICIERDRAVYIVQ